MHQIMNNDKPKSCQATLRRRRPGQPCERQLDVRTYRQSPPRWAQWSQRAASIGLDSESALVTLCSVHHRYAIGRGAQLQLVEG